MSVLIVYLVGCVVCYVVSVGWVYAQFQRRFLFIADENRADHARFALWWSAFPSIFSLAGLLPVWLIAEPAKYGWLLPFTKSKF